MTDYVELVSELRESAEWADRLAVLMGRDVGDSKAPLMRKAADAIEELLKENAELDNSGRVLMAAFARLKEKVPQWISVEKRLPEQGERVLVSNGGFICESYLSQSGKWQRGGVDMFFMTPTHWMPLLKPPKEENKR